MFNRLFGKKQKKEEEPPPPDMDEVSGRMDSRMSTLQNKVRIDYIGETYWRTATYMQFCVL